MVADVDAVATAEAAAELVERAFGLHRLTGGADCGREDLLVGDWCMVSAAEMIAGIQRADVEATFARAATTAAVGEDFKPALRQAVATVAETPPPPANNGRVSKTAGAIPDAELIALLERRLSGILAEEPELDRAPM